MTSNYCKNLEALRSKAAHELKEVGDQWRTPDLLFWGINAMFGPLVLDLFADDSNAKCPTWYTAEDNALTQDWSERVAELGGAAFGNPPYSRSQYHEKQAVTGMTHIINHAMAMREKGGRYVFLIKAATGEAWWPEDADHVVIIRGRISFDLPDWYRPDEGQPAESSAGFGAVIAIFDKSWRGERFSYIQRTELEAKGRAFISLAHFAIGKSAPQPTDISAPEPTQIEEKTETELPLTKQTILEISGVEVWACVTAAFGAKEEYTFSESKFAHTWAADSVVAPEFATVSPFTIDRAKQLVCEHILVGVNAWLESLQFDDDETRADMSERIRTVALELSREYGVKHADFILIMESLEKDKWSNIRNIRAHFREKIEPKKVPFHESRIWPLEVGLIFDQLVGAETLQVSQHDKVKAHINQLWLERMPNNEIIAVAGGLVASIQGEV